MDENWETLKKIMHDHLILRKKNKASSHLLNSLVKALNVKEKNDILPEFTYKIIQNKQYGSIIDKIKNYLNI